MKTTIRREEDRVWLEGVNGWFVGDKESSVHAAQAAVMETVTSRRAKPRTSRWPSPISAAAAVKA